MIHPCTSVGINWQKKEIREGGPTSRRCWSRSGCRQHRWRSEAERSQTSSPPLGRSRCPCSLVLLSHCKKERDTKETISSIGKMWLHCFVVTAESCWTKRLLHPAKDATVMKVKQQCSTIWLRLFIFQRFAQHVSFHKCNALHCTVAWWIWVLTAATAACFPPN